MLGILRKYMAAFAWSVQDIKGISPTIFMYKIFIKEEYKSSFENQRRLNLVMKEVVN